MTTEVTTTGHAEVTTAERADATTAGRAGAAAGVPLAGAAITGIGVVAPNGFGTEDYWRATLDGRGGIGPVTRFDPRRYAARLAGEVRGFEPRRHLPSRLLPQTDHMTRLALVAADLALADAGLDPTDLPAYGAGVVTASASGGFEFGQRELQKLWSLGGEHVSAYQSFAWFYAVNTGQISIRHGLKGPSGVLVTEQAGGLDVLAQARRYIRKGIPVVLSGGVDSALCPWGWIAQSANGRVAAGDDPDTAFRPFHPAAAGYVPGEGGAILVVEDPVAAAARGAVPVALVAGYAATFDPPPGSGRPGGLRRAIELALADAGAGAGDVDVVFADAAGVPALDRAEADALVAVFGPRGVAVTAPKTMTGRLASGGAALDVAAAALALRDGVVPPTVNVGVPAFPIDLVTEARPARLRTAVVVARGYGGFNAAVVLRHPDTTQRQQRPQRPTGAAT